MFLTAVATQNRHYAFVNLMQELTSILSEATKSIPGEYFQLPVAGKEDPIYREREYIATNSIITFGHFGLTVRVILWVEKWTSLVILGFARTIWIG